MQINQHFEERLWSVSYEKPLDAEIGTQIVDYLFARLSSFLQNPIEPIENYGEIDSGFCVNFRDVINNPNIFHIALGEKVGMEFLEAGNTLTFGGTLGMQFIDEDFGSHTSANIYLFGNHQRLILKDHGNVQDNYIYLDYARDKNNIGNWVSRGWKMDEFWEWEGIEEADFF